MALVDFINCIYGCNDEPQKSEKYIKTCSSCNNLICIKTGNCIDNKMMKKLGLTHLYQVAKQWKPTEAYGHTHGIDKWHYYCTYACEKYYNNRDNGLDISLKNYIDFILFDKEISPESDSIHIVSECQVCKKNITVFSKNIIEKDLVLKINSLEKLKECIYKWYSQTQSSFGYYDNDWNEEFVFYCSYDCMTS
jgi:hypothetical protein